MTKDEVAKIMAQVFDECNALRNAGQKEYVHKDENAFANFERVADYLQGDRKKILMIYLLKHIDGITAYVNGHVSQRESVTGRMNDVIVYLCLLRGMIEEDNNKEGRGKTVIIPEHRFPIPALDK